MTTRILLVDGHAIVRQGLRVLLEADPQFSIVGEASDGNRAVEMAGRLRPDPMIVDLNVPGLDGLETVRLAKHGSPRIRILVFSTHAGEAYVANALDRAGYVDTARQPYVYWSWDPPRYKAIVRRIRADPAYQIPVDQEGILLLKHRTPALDAVKSVPR